MRLEGEKLGHCQLTRFIQGGGMGEVYLAEDLTLSRQVAIKVMKTEPVLYPDTQASKDAARLFQREMRAISMLDHAHILTLLEAGEQQIGHDNIAYMVMPYCPEGSLADWIRRYHSTKPLSPDEVAQILQQAADALQYAHDQQILHLDIKPSNFLVRRQQDPSQLPNLLLADFGVAKMATTSKLSGTVRGTLEYMAPEQLAGTPVAASDQYALGIMVYELLTGHTPFHGTLPQAIPHMHANVDPKPPSIVNPSVPSTLDAIVLLALAKKPQDRFASVKEFSSAFVTALNLNAAQPSGTKTTLEQTTAPSPNQPLPMEWYYQQEAEEILKLQEALVHRRKPPQMQQQLPRQRPVDTKQPRQQQMLPQQKGLLSPQAYEFATAYQLGTPLEEFRVTHKASFIIIGLLPLILSFLFINAPLIILLLVIIFLILPSIYYLFYPKFHRSWCVYLYSGGFVYTHSKKVDVFPWNQIRKAEKATGPLRYIIIRRDSKKIILKDIFQSIDGKWAE